MALTVGGVAIDLQANASQVVREMDRAARATLSASQKMQGGVGGWRAGFQRAEAGITGFAGRVRQSLGSVGRALPSLLGIGGLAGGAGLAGLASLAKQSFNTASAIVDAADKAGIGTAAYQALAFQAAQVDLSLESLNTGLTTFATRVGQAQAGTGPLHSTMKKLNPELAETLRLATSQEQALRIVADAMAGAATQTERLALEQAAFGRGAGGAFVLAIGGGAKAMDDATAKARAMGVVLEDDLLRQAEAAGDQLDVLSQVINARLTAAVVRAAPEITAMVTAFADAIPAISQFATETIATLQWWSDQGFNIFENTKREIETVKAAWQSVKSFFTGTATTTGGPASEMAEQLGQAVPPGSGLSRIPTMPKPQEIPIPLPVEPRPPAVMGGRGIGGLSGGAGEDKLFGGSGIDRLERKLIAPAPPKPDVPIPIPLPVIARGAAGGPLAREIAGPPLPEKFGPPTPDMAVLHEEQRGLEINRQLEERQRLYDQLTNTANMFASTVSQGLTSAITGAQTFDEALRGIAEALIEAAIQAAIFQAISAAIGTPGPAGGGALGAAFPAAAGARAGGGPVRAGSAYKVGERGSEYFVPSVGGTILTQSQMAGAGGGRGGGDVYNIYADRIDPGTAARLVNTARAGAPAATVNAMSRGTVRSERRPPF
jgi:hypothetical protein